MVIKVAEMDLMTLLFAPGGHNSRHNASEVGIHNTSPKCVGCATAHQVNNTDTEFLHRLIVNRNARVSKLGYQQSGAIHPLNSLTWFRLKITAKMAPNCS